MDFYWCPSSLIKTPGRIFWKSVSPKAKKVEETKIRFIKNSIRIYQDDQENKSIYILYNL